MASGRFIKFASGGLFGAGIGTALAILFAPQSGDILRTRVNDRLKLARLAGIEAQAETEAAIIGRYRTKMGDQSALTELESTNIERRNEEIRQLTVVPRPVGDVLVGSTAVV